MNENIATIHKLNIKDFIKSLHGRVFRIDFEKKDGSIRRMIAKYRRVPTEQRSDRAWTKDIRHNVSMPVWSFDAGGYRSINLDTILEIKVNGTIYKPVC